MVYRPAYPFEIKAAFSDIVLQSVAVLLITSGECTETQDYYSDGISIVPSTVEIL
jgi:hypothetical protein